MAPSPIAHESSFRLCLFNLADKTPLTVGSCTLLKEGTLDLQLCTTDVAQDSSGSTVVLCDSKLYRAFATARHVLYVKGSDEVMQPLPWGIYVAPQDFRPGSLAFIDMQKDLAVVLVKKADLPPEVASLEGVGLGGKLAIGDRLDIFGFPLAGFPGMRADRTDGCVVNVPGNPHFLQPNIISTTCEINGDVHSGNSGTVSAPGQIYLTAVVSVGNTTFHCGSSGFIVRFENVLPLTGGGVFKAGESDLSAIVITKQLNTSAVLQQVVKDSRFLAEVHSMSAWSIDTTEKEIPNTRVDLDGLITRIAEESTRITHLGRGAAIPIQDLTAFIASSPHLHTSVQDYPKWKDESNAISAVYALPGGGSTTTIFQ